MDGNIRNIASPIKEERGRDNDINIFITKEDKVGEELRKRIIDQHVDRKLLNIQNDLETLKLQIGNLQIQNSNIADKINLEKNSDYLKLKSNIDESFTNVLNKISTNKNDFINYKLKIDKVLQENLDVPKIIGIDKCKFKNLKEFIEVSYGT